MTHTHTYARLAVPRHILDVVVSALNDAGPEYVRDWVETDKDGNPMRIILSQVALVPLPTLRCSVCNKLFERNELTLDKNVGIWKIPYHGGGKPKHCEGSLGDGERV